MSACQECCQKKSRKIVQNRDFYISFHVPPRFALSLTRSNPLCGGNCRGDFLKTAYHRTGCPFVLSPFTIPVFFLFSASIIIAFPITHYTFLTQGFHKYMTCFTSNFHTFAYFLYNLHNFRGDFFSISFHISIAQWCFACYNQSMEAPIGASKLRRYRL